MIFVDLARPMTTPHIEPFTGGIVYVPGQWAYLYTDGTIADLQAFLTRLGFPATQRVFLTYGIPRCRLTGEQRDQAVTLGAVERDYFAYRQAQIAQGWRREGWRP